MPETPTDLLLFRQAVRSLVTNDDVPLVIHCSAGVGRTGTFIGVDRCIMQCLDMGGTVNVDAIVTNMRQARTHMVQTEQQYLCIHQTILAAVEWLLQQSKTSTMQRIALPAQGASHVEDIYDNYQIALATIPPRTINANANATTDTSSPPKDPLTPLTARLSHRMSLLDPLHEEPPSPSALPNHIAMESGPPMHSRGGSGTAVFPGFSVEHNSVRLQSVRRENPLFSLSAQPTSPLICDPHEPHDRPPSEIEIEMPVPEPTVAENPHIIRLCAATADFRDTGPHSSYHAEKKGSVDSVGTVASAEDRKYTQWSLPGDGSHERLESVSPTISVHPHVPVVGGAATRDANLKAPSKPLAQDDASPKMMRAARRAAMDSKLKVIDSMAQSFDDAIEAVRRAATPRTSMSSEDGLNGLGLGTAPTINTMSTSASLGHTSQPYSLSSGSTASSTTEMWPPPKAQVQVQARSNNTNNTTQHTVIVPTNHTHVAIHTTDATHTGPTPHAHAHARPLNDAPATPPR